MQNQTTNQYRIETRQIKHNFTPPERGDIGATLARAIGEHRGIEAEFDQVKASYKAKLTECEARIDSVSTSLVNGFEMRPEKCIVAFRPVARKKDFYLAIEFKALADEAGTEEAFIAAVNNGVIKPVLTEDMTTEDFQAELIQAESKFEHRDVIDLFQPAGADQGVLVVGKFNGRWYSALRVQVGKHKLEERLDSEQKSYKSREDAVKRAGKRALDWFEAEMKEAAKGFEEPIAKAIASQMDKVE